jgi:hypothetical protein
MEQRTANYVSKTFTINIPTVQIRLCKVDEMKAVKWLSSGT